MKSTTISYLMRKKMYISEVDVFIYTIIHYLLLGVVKGKGGVRLDNSGGGGVDTSQYPSKSRRKYYNYYINYFTGESFNYARQNLQSDRTESICENYEPYYGNETELGEFPCPMLNDPDDFGYCCGSSQYEYCCRLVDTFNFRLMVGMTSAAVLGALIGIIVCVIFYVKAKKNQRRRKKSNVQHMQQMGITHYEKQDTRKYVARQSDDGYHILTKFKKNKFYQAFWTELYAKYQKLSWKISRDKSTKEVKVTFPEGGWVSIVLVDELDGYPQMVVSREKSAVKWMNTVFQEICDKILAEADDKLCGCFGTRGSQRRIEPTNENPKAKKYANQENSTQPKKEKARCSDDDEDAHKSYDPKY